jgi:2-oxo-4-hydroxy-4-carboxy-5-ureidoimidazoline decarboxylase
MTIRQINSMTAGEFVQAFGSVFESSRWVADRAWKTAPFRSLDELREQMNRAVAEASHEEQLALIRAHPDLGTRARMSRSSSDEQAGAGLDRLPHSGYERLLQLNAAYRERFGFPFIFAVRGSDQATVLRELEKRLHSTPEQEFAEALRQVYRIARFRIEEVAAGEPEGHH